MVLGLASKYKLLSPLSLALKPSNKKSCNIPTGREESGPCKQRPSCLSSRVYVGNWDFVFVSC